MRKHGFEEQWKICKQEREGERDVQWTIQQFNESKALKNKLLGLSPKPAKPMNKLLK